ncbi:MAG: monovalent cation/H(+) antiporter subunit G [Acidiferrobacterales bacterium]|nr:monovalent cation/H(+) antiporter subunit G [Acidiferrobacterales bacterium]
MSEIISSLLLLIAATVILLASLGLLRMPDVPTRMHATTKSGVLAIIVIMAAVSIYFGRIDVSARVIAIIIFTLISAPIAAHAIGRAAYLSGVKLCKETVRDELQDYYQEDLNQESKK